MEFKVIKRNGNAVVPDGMFKLCGMENVKLISMVQLNGGILLMPESLSTYQLLMLVDALNELACDFLEAVAIECGPAEEEHRGMTLDEVLDVMNQAEKDGKMIVRLHTGEPSIYGAVREQMDELDRLGIGYESCPGVSACFGAAASLNIEYTLPDISQSLIITRMEGRTSVPPKESIESFAAHQASMAIYLSTGLLEELCERLIAGGYTKDTPAALVYKATWPEEEAYVCTVGTLPETANAHAITKTAIVLVGEVITHQHYRKSRLYAPDFSTEYREAKR